MVKNHLVRLLKGTSIYGIGQMTNQLVAFLLLPVFTAYLTPEDFGIISILGIISFLVVPIFRMGVGVSSGMLYFAGDNNARKCEVIWTAFVILLISATILTVLGLLLSKEISYLAFQADVYQYYVKLHIISAALAIILQPLEQRLQFEEKAKLFVGLTLVSSIATICLNILFVVLLGRGVLGWIVGTLIGRSLTCVLFFVAVKLSTEFRVELSVGKGLLRHGSPMIPSFAFLFIMEQSGKYVLQWYHGLDEVGIYTIGYNFGKFMGLAVASFTTAWYPYFQSFVNRKDEAKVVFGKVFTYYVLVFGALSLLFFIYARPVISIMTRPAFHEAYKVVGMVGVAQVFIGVFSIFSAAVFYAKKVHFISAVQLVSSIVVIVSNVILIPAYGLTGAAFSMMLGFMTMGVLQQKLNMAKKFWNPEYEWMRIARFICLYVAVVGCVTFLGMRLSLQVYSLCLPVLSLILVLTLWMFLSKQEKSFVREYALKLRGK